MPDPLDHRAQEKVIPLGIPVAPDSVFPYLLSVSALVQVFVLPVVGALADRTRRKRELLARERDATA